MPRDCIYHGECMPHIIVSYSEPILDKETSRELLIQLQKVSAHFETVSPDALKLRACSFDHAWSGVNRDSHLHISFMLLPGRTIELKKSMAEALHLSAVTFFTSQSNNDVSVTVEVKELGVYKK